MRVAFPFSRSIVRDMTAPLMIKVISGPRAMMRYSFQSFDLTSFCNAAGSAKEETSRLPLSSITSFWPRHVIVPRPLQS